MFTTYDLRNFLEGLAILFAIGYWGIMLLLLWFLVRFAYNKAQTERRQNPFRQPDRRRYPDTVRLDDSQTIRPEQRRNTGTRRMGNRLPHCQHRHGLFQHTVSATKNLAGLV